jgi:general secretion pathway protein I
MKEHGFLRPETMKKNGVKKMKHRKRGIKGGMLRSSSGFTLLEVLLALVIVGLAVTAILQLFSANLRSISMSEDSMRAVMIAEAKMREIVGNTELSEKSWTETTGDGYRMDVAVSSIVSERARTMGTKLLQVDLVLSWRMGLRNRSITLSTLKLVGIPEPKMTVGGRT